MQIKKLLACVSALIICYGVVSNPQVTDTFTSMVASAEDEEYQYSGSCGENATFNFDETTGTLTISGTGNMEDYVSYNAPPWYNYCESIKNVIIEDGITSIGYEAFYDGCTSLESVTIPNSVTEIWDRAFCDCTSLTEITIPNSVTIIGMAAFGGCTSLTEVTIPDSITEIVWGTFSDCTSLTKITIPNTVTHIGCFAFCDSTSLTEITIPSSVTEIDENSLGCYYYEETGEYLKIEDFTIYGVKGTEAEHYAIDNDFTFIEIQETDTPTIDPYANFHFDVNNDGSVDVMDLLFLKKKILDII